MDQISYAVDLGAIVALCVVPAIVSLVRVWARVNALEQKQAATDSQLAYIEKRLESFDQKFSLVMVELGKISTKLDILLPNHPNSK